AIIPASRSSAMRSSRPMAAKCCWSISSRVSARPRWCSAPARARREHGRYGFTDRAGVAAAAKPGLLGAGDGSPGGTDGAGAAMVDIAGGDFYGLLAGRGGVHVRLPYLRQIFDASDLRPTIRLRSTGRHRHPVV